MMNESVFSFLTEEVALQLDLAQTEEEFRRVLTEAGASEEEILRFVDHLRTMPLEASGEMSEDDLDMVAGGGNPIGQKIIRRWAYRFKYGKIFVKATYDEDAKTITVTNRFGKEKISETLPY